MIEDDISKLNDQGLDHPLDRLEADIWARAAQRLEADRLSRKILTCQIVVMLGALLFIVAAGNRVGHATAERTPSALGFANEMNLAPSTLLLGHQT